MALIEKESRLGQDLDLLITIPGIGKTTAAMILAELGDLAKFNEN